MELSIYKICVFGFQPLVFLLMSVFSYATSINKILKQRNTPDPTISMLENQWTQTTRWVEAPGHAV